MLFYLFAIFVVLPLVELTLLLWVGHVTDWRVSLLLVIATGAIGSFLVRRQGARAWQRVQSDLRKGSLPTDSISDGALIFIAGLLLITPGLITDLVGISLLIPICRGWYKRHVLAWFKSRFQFKSLAGGWRSPGESGGNGTFQEGRLSGSRVIDSYVVAEPPELEKKPPP